MAGAPPPTVVDARDGGSRPSRAAGIQEATTMTATVSRETSLERLLGTVGQAMTGKVVVLTADTPADVAARRLEQAQVSGAPVVDRGRVVGVVTLRDLLVAAQAAPTAQTTGPFLRYEHRLAGYRVQELMTAEPLTARADWPLSRVVLAMRRPASTGSRWSTTTAGRLGSSPATTSWARWPDGSAGSHPPPRAGPSSSPIERHRRQRPEAMAPSSHRP
jgi:CBS domain